MGFGWLIRIKYDMHGSSVTIPSHGLLQQYESILKRKLRTSKV